MWIYLDTNIVIYAVENTSGSWRQSSITPQVLRVFDGFFRRPDVAFLPLTDNVFRRVLVIQAMNNFATVDSLHLATAVEHGCNVFLTNDNRLASFTDVTVEILA